MTTSRLGKNIDFGAFGIDLIEAFQNDFFAG